MRKPSEWRRRLLQLAGWAAIALIWGSLAYCLVLAWQESGH